MASPHVELHRRVKFWPLDGKEAFTNSPRTRHKNAVSHCGMAISRRKSARWPGSPWDIAFGTAFDDSPSKPSLGVRAVTLRSPEPVFQS